MTQIGNNTANSLNNTANLANIVAPGSRVANTASTVAQSYDLFTSVSQGNNPQGYSYFGNRNFGTGASLGSVPPPLPRAYSSGNAQVDSVADTVAGRVSYGLYATAEEAKGFCSVGGEELAGEIQVPGMEETVAACQDKIASEIKALGPNVSSAQIQTLVSASAEECKQIVRDKVECAANVAAEKKLAKEQARLRVENNTAASPEVNQARSEQTEVEEDKLLHASEVHTREGSVDSHKVADYYG